MGLMTGEWLLESLPLRAKLFCHCKAENPGRWSPTQSIHFPLMFGYHAPDFCGCLLVGRSRINPPRHMLGQVVDLKQGQSQKDTG